MFSLKKFALLPSNAKKNSASNTKIMNAYLTFSTGARQYEKCATYFGFPLLRIIIMNCNFHFQNKSDALLIRD